jgi:hypothetical protein
VRGSGFVGAPDLHGEPLSGGKMVGSSGERHEAPYHGAARNRRGFGGNVLGQMGRNCGRSTGGKPGVRRALLQGEHFGISVN